MPTEMQRHDITGRPLEVFNEMRILMDSSREEINPLQMIALLAQLIGIVVASANFNGNDEAMIIELVDKNINHAIEQCHELMAGRQGGHA